MTMSPCALSLLLMLILFPLRAVTITDSSDNVVRRLTGPVSAGMQRLNWDLRYPAANLSAPRPPDADADFEPPSGPLVMPGTYKASVAKRVEGVVTPLGPPQEFQVTVEGQENMSTSDRAALVEFQQKAARLQRAVSGATQAANALRPRLAAVKRAVAETPSLPLRLQEEATALEKRTNEILLALSGDTEARRRNMNTPPSINDRVNYVVGAQRMSTSASDSNSAQSIRCRGAGLRRRVGPVASTNRSRSGAFGKTVGGGRRALDPGKNSVLAVGH